ncbi:MAG: MATE family efflux transporter [Clostridia bacterium]|nr:MATE family efflux transporter [Clostridia bacterium]
MACVGASDTIMLGSLEQNAMSAVSLATQIQFVQNVSITGVVAAFSVLGAQYRGKKDSVTVNKIFFMSFRIAVLVSIIFASLCFFMPTNMMKIFTNEQVLIDMGASYLKIAACSYLMVGCSQCFLALMKLSERASVVAKISGVAVVLNICLNAIFIFGLLGAPAMGVRGAALATTIARIVELLWASIYCMSNKDLRPDFAFIFTNEKQLTKDFVRQLIPLMGAYVIWTIGIASYSAFMGHMGVDAAAANSVASVVRSFISGFRRGFAAGAAIVIGNELGAGNLKRAKIYGDRIVILSLICGVFSSLCIVVSIVPALKLVTLSPEATGNFYTIMAILAIYMIGVSLNGVVINGLFQAGGDTAFDCYSLAVMMWCLAIPLAAAGTFLFHWPIAVVYGCTCLDEVGKIPWVMAHYKKGKWLKDLTRSSENLI